MSADTSWLKWLTNFQMTGCAWDMRGLLYSLDLRRVNIRARPRRIVATFVRSRILDPRSLRYIGISCDLNNTFMLAFFPPLPPFFLPRLENDDGFLLHRIHGIKILYSIVRIRDLLALKNGRKNFDCYNMFDAGYIFSSGRYWKLSGIILLKIFSWNIYN